MAEWRKRTFGDLGTIYDGPHATPERRSSGPYFLNIASLNDGHLDLSKSDHVSSDDFQKWTRRVTPRPGDLLFSYETRLGEAALMPDGVEACLGRRVALLRPDTTAVDPRFLLYCYLAPAVQKTIEQNTIHGATVNRIPLNRMASWPIEIPDLAEQRAIAEVLGALDDKIAADRRLLDVGMRHMDANYASDLAEGACHTTIGEIASFQNRRRIPLSSRERDERHGAVPYYGASGPIDTVDEALFDEPLVLVGEDGSVINDDRTPVSQYIWGPAWVNNHAHVLKGTRVSTELLYLAVRKSDVSTLVTGAVQPKISMGNLRNLQIAVPAEDRRPELEHRCASWFALYRALFSEIESLVIARDALLPALMSGELRVKEAERLAEDLT